MKKTYDLPGNAEETCCHPNFYKNSLKLYHQRYSIQFRDIFDDHGESSLFSMFLKYLVEIKLISNKAR
jgi:hypothetical protein